MLPPGVRPRQDPQESQIPVWRRNNGKFVAFFRSFMSPRPGKEKSAAGGGGGGGSGGSGSRVFGTELTKLLADTGDEGKHMFTVQHCTLLQTD